MKNERIFEIATRERFRFNYKGQISVEDLWLLSVKELDEIFKSLNKQLKQTKEESLLETKTQQDRELDMKIEIVKYIVAVKLEEDKLRLKAKETKEKKQKILEVLSRKKNEALEKLDIDTLEKQLEELDG